MALKLNLKKDELISVAVEMGLKIPSKAKIIDLKKLIESSAVYKNDIEFVRCLVENALEKSKQEAEKNERKAEIQLEKIKLSQIEKQLELAKITQVTENRVHCGLIVDDDLNKTLKKFWEIEGVHIEPKVDREVSLCEDHFVRTHRRNCVGRYVVSMALNKDPSCIGNSKHIAIRRLNSLWKRLSRDSSYLSLYAEFLKEYEELGHLERVVESSERPTHYYIPHHGVLRPEKLTTKLRIVFNGSSPTTTGISLNDILLKGEVKGRVFETISRFRRHKFAFTTDIQKMYRQILINPDQQDLQRIIWKHGLDAEILTYRLKTVTYGLSNAPFLAIRTLQQLAKDEKSRFPLASETLLYDTYMDDIVSGAPDLETAQQLQSQLKDALQSCGMNLHK
ncbi:integrase catalytic domain-containing protein [Trichonephila clavipes]|nr:integrase catalytic domain-containing protein [Trichonephila clavipes]